MIRWVYSLLMWLAQPLLRRKLRRRALAEPVYAQALGERFGYYTVAAEALAPGTAAQGTTRLFVRVHDV